MENAWCSDVVLCCVVLCCVVLCCVVLCCVGCKQLPVAHNTGLVNRNMVHSGSYATIGVIMHKRIVPRLTEKLEF
jgi:hypothetical protein